MLDIAPRLSIRASRFPPIPYVDPPPRRMSEADKRLILLALAARGPLLPTDWPDLTPLLNAVDAAIGGAENAA